jgi:hypothetical protein
MAYSSFPSYAQFLTTSYEETMSGGVERSETDDGFVQQVPLQSLGRVEIMLTYRLPSEQAKADFEAWRRQTLANGALHFEWTHPQGWAGDVKYRARMVGGKCKYTPLNNRLDDWQVSFALEYFA